MYSETLGYTEYHETLFGFLLYRFIFSHNPSVTVHGKILVGEKVANLVNHQLFAKTFLDNIHRYTENVVAYALTVAYSPYFSSPIAFTCMLCQKFSLPKFSHVR